MEVDSNDGSKLLDSHGKELTIDDVMEIREKNAAEETDTSDAVLPEKHMTVASLTEGLNSIEKGCLLYTSRCV